MLSANKIDDADLSRLFAYWDERRRAGGDGRAAPTRDDIDPLSMDWMLGRLMLIDTADSIGDFRVRLFGTTIATEFGEDRTGLRFRDIANVENLDEVFERYLSVYQNGVPNYETGRTVSNLRRYRGYSRLLLPLSNDGVSVAMILVGVSFFGNSNSN